VLLTMNQEQSKNVTEQIWQELSDRLRQFVRSRVASASDVDDVLQTVFLRIHAKIDDLQQVERLESWVFQVTRNAVVDHYRKSQTTQEDFESPIAAPDEKDLQNLNAELAGCLVSFVDRLPDDQRRALSLYEFEGVSQKDIASRESISLSGAKSRIQRGRKALETMLKDCCEFQFDRRGNVLDYESNAASCCDEECD